MPTHIREGLDDLLHVDYGPILDALLNTLRERAEQSFVSRPSTDKRRPYLLCKLDTLANQAAARVKTRPILEGGYGTATLNMQWQEIKRLFAKSAREIAWELDAQLEEEIQATVPGLAPNDFLTGLLTPLSGLNSAEAAGSLNLSYDFATPYNNLSRQRVQLQAKETDSAPLVAHKATIRIKGGGAFLDALAESIKRDLGRRVLDAEDRADLLAKLEDEKANTASELQELRRLLERETLGKLKREALFCYLEVLHDQSKASQGQSTQPSAAHHLLVDLIRRLRALDDFFANRDGSRSTDAYTVAYRGATLNLQDALARADAWDGLPVIPRVQGYLGETGNPATAEHDYVFGLKVKLNGKVARKRGGPSSFAYHLRKIDPRHQIHV